jgi:protein involved in polysaccharide export with SLBB domain
MRSIHRPAAAVLAMALVAGCEPTYRTGVKVQPPIHRLSPTSLGFEPSTVAFHPMGDYRIMPGDVVSIRFPRRPAFSDTFLVRPDGKISPPLIGSVLAASRTSDELQAALVARYRQLLASVPPPSRRRYLLRVDDVVEVRFPYTPEMNSVVTVRADGRISLPLIGSVIAEGKSPTALQDELKQLYADKLTNPQPVVILKDARSDVYEYRGRMQEMPDPEMTELYVNITKTAPQLIYVGGEVPAPGLQAYLAGTSELQAVYAAGGPTPAAEMRSVILLRRGPDGSMIRSVTNLKSDEAGTGTGDTMLRPYDIVIVPRSRIALVGDALDQYIYRVLRPLSNSSLGFFFTKQVGTTQQQTDTTVHNPTSP